MSSFFSTFAPMMQKHLYIALLALLSLTACGAEIFSPLEQQQISIETIGLFQKADSFQVDFLNLKPEKYSFPLPVGKISSMTAHDMEIETKKGDVVRAMFDGTVRLSRHNPTYGNVIVVRHDMGLETVYAFNAQNLVRSGERVKAGQPIAIVGGQAGRTSCLVAFMVDGRRINPAIIVETHSHDLRRQKITFRKVAGHVDISVTRPPAKPLQMSMSTNNPFGKRAVWRINLNEIPGNAWHYPLDNAHVISGYANNRGDHIHSGVDIKNGPKNKVYAAFDGLVVQSGPYSAYGNCITLRHAIGIETRYSHNSKNLVKVGDKVKAGDVIAIVGRTGRATTEHVHFETRIADRPFDPAYIFDHDKNELRKGVLQFKKNGSVKILK